MKYYKTENTFGKQPNNIVPDFATEITEEEYIELTRAFEERQKKISQYVEQVNSGVITLEDVPAEYFDEVRDIVNAPEPEPTYTLDEASEIISAEVSADE